MSIDKIFGGKSTGPIEQVKARETEAARGRDGKDGKDRVEFSSLLQEVNKSKAADPAHSVERARKVAALKAQVAAGTYRPDLEKVAESLLKAMAEEK